MLKTKGGYKLISDKDLFISMEYAVNHNKEDILKKLNDLFTDIEGVTVIGEESYHKIDDKNLIYFVLDEVKLIDEETYVDRNVLKEAYVISKYEKNIEMNKKIYSYLIKYLNNEVNGISNEVLIQEIINDKPLLEYLKKYENLDDFITCKVNKKVSKMDYYINKRTKEKKKIA